MYKLISQFPLYTSRSNFINFILILGLLSIIMLHAYRYLTIAGKDNKYNFDDNKIPMGNQVSNIFFLLSFFYKIFSSNVNSDFSIFMYYMLIISFAIQSYMLVLGVFLEITRFNYSDLLNISDNEEYKKFMINLRIHRHSAFILLIGGVVLTRISLMFYFSNDIKILYLALLFLSFIVLNLCNNRYSKVYHQLKNTNNKNNKETSNEQVNESN